MILKQVIHYPDTNSVEATWVDASGKQVKCHSYADVQMDALAADLGKDAVQHAALMALVKANIQPTAPVPVVIPSSLSMRQARLALLGAGLLDAVQAGVSAMPQAAQIEWDYATTVERSSPLVATLAASLGLTSEALDALFTAGAAL